MTFALVEGDAYVFVGALMAIPDNAFPDSLLQAHLSLLRQLILQGDTVGSLLQLLLLVLLAETMIALCI